MKKFYLLTSILALAACGGGSGGGGSNSSVSEATRPYVDPIRTSNSKVTGMVSNSKYQVVRYVVNKLGSDDAAAVNLSRGATTRGSFVPSPATGDVDYDKAQELVDLAAWLVNDSTSHDDITNMFNTSTTDKNKIKAALKLMNDMWCFVGGDANETANRIISRRSSFETPLAELQHNTEVFNVSDARLILSDGGFGGELKFDVDENTGEITGFELLPDEDDPEDEGMSFTTRLENSDAGHTQFQGTVEDQPAVLTYNSLGKELGLKYSDFGSFDIDRFDNWRVPLAGGYESKRITEMPTDEVANHETLSFQGKATGHVLRPNYYGDGDPAVIQLNAPASLKFYGHEGKTVMTASFSNWYDVEYTKIRTDAGNVNFTNYKQNELGADLNLSNATGETNVQVTGEDIRYFGDNNIPTEAVGLIQVRDCAGAACNDHEDEDYLRMNLGFGAK